jgi:hypothetical protein
METLCPSSQTLIFRANIKRYRISYSFCDVSLRRKFTPIVLHRIHPKGSGLPNSLKTNDFELASRGAGGAVSSTVSSS